MADDHKEDEQLEPDKAKDSENTEAADQNHKQNKSKKKLLIITGASILIILGLALGATIFLKKSNSSESHTQESNSEKTSKAEGSISKTNEPKTTFVDINEFIVNLNTGGRGTSFLKLKVRLEVANKSDADVIVKLMPKLRDIFQVYLRELRPYDVQGSAGLYRLKAELIMRANKVLYPTQILDVLFEEILTQ